MQLLRKSLRRSESKLTESEEIETDGITVWVNREWCLARFGKMGIDIHRSPDEAKEKGQCLFCTHGPTTIEDWELFKQKMLELYGVEVSDEYKPDRFKES